MNGIITIALKEEKYYHWTSILFNSILLYTNVEFALVYDNNDWFVKYNLDKIVKYPIYKNDIENPYMFKYKLIEYTPFDNTIFFDADTIIFKDISPLFLEQPFSICAEWDGDYLYKEYNPFVKRPDIFVKEFNLPKFYSTYSGYIRFEKTDYFKQLFKDILSKEHHTF
jgi:alpha-N-acetylglucosamine transferase